MNEQRLPLATAKVVPSAAPAPSYCRFFAAFPSPILSCLNAQVRKTTSMHQMATGENAKKLRPSRRSETQTSHALRGAKGTLGYLDNRARQKLFKWLRLQSSQRTSINSSSNTHHYSNRLNIHLCNSFLSYSIHLPLESCWKWLLRFED